MSPLSLRGTRLSACEHRIGYVRCPTSTLPVRSAKSPLIAMKFEASATGAKRAAVRRAVAKVFRWHGENGQNGRRGVDAYTGDIAINRKWGLVGAERATRRPRRAGRLRGVTSVRKSVAGVAAAVIIRTTFASSAASALPAPVGMGAKSVPHQVNMFP